MPNFENKIPLTIHWRHPHIQSSAAILAFANQVELNPLVVEDAQQRLCAVGEELELDPDQLHRAMSEHEPFLGFQEEDTVLMEGAFSELLRPINPKLPLE